MLGVGAVVLYFIWKRYGSSEIKLGASGIGCWCKRKDGSTKYQECRGTKYKDCESCCSHYGYEVIPDVSW